MYTRILLFVLVLLAPITRAAVGTTPGGGGGGVGGPTNGVTGTQVTNIVNAMAPGLVTNRIPTLNGKGTNTYLTNLMAGGSLRWTNVNDWYFQNMDTNDNIIHRYNFGDNGGSVYTWNSTWTSNYWRVNTRVGIAAVNQFYLYRDGNIDLGNSSSQNTTNRNTVRHVADVYLPAPSGTATNLTLDPNGKVVAVTNAGPAASGGLATNETQFAANTTLTLKDGARLTNIVFTSSRSYPAGGGSNFTMNTQSGRVYGNFATVESSFRTIWITNSLVSTNSVVVITHSGTDAISGGLLPPLSCSAVAGLLKIHMSQSSWNTVGNVAYVSWFLTNPGE